MKTQNGFAAFEALLILVIAGIIAGTGIYVMKAKNNTEQTLDKTSNSSTIVPKSKTSKASAPATQPSQKYLEIKEWGIKVPLSSTIESAVYSSAQYSTGSSSATGGSAKLGLLSLGSDCSDTADAPLGQFVRFTRSDVAAEDPNNIQKQPSLHDLATAATTVSGYMYAYAAPQSVCDSGSTDTINSATSELQQAIKNLKPDDN